MAMSGVLRDMGLNGCAHWMVLQAKEECNRAVKIFEHMLSRNAKVRLLPLGAPKQDWRAPLHIFEEMLRHEQRISMLVDDMYEIAVSEKDHQTQCFLSWFVEQQAEEEMRASNMLDRLRKMQGTDLGVIMFDAELARRT
jgi:ferritin